MADPLLSHRHPNDHRHCTPRRQLVSIRQASGDDPEYVVNLDERHPIVVAAIRDVEEQRRDTALRCLQERTLSVAAVEGERRPQQDVGPHQAPSRRPVVGFPQPAVPSRSHHDFGSSSFGSFNSFSAERRPQQAFGLPALWTERPVLGYSQPAVPSRSHHDFGSSSFGSFNSFSAERRPQQAFGLPALWTERPVLGYSQPAASRRSRRASGTPCVRPSAERHSQQDTGLLQDSSQQAGVFTQAAVCRRHRQELGSPSARPFPTFSSTSAYPPASSNIRPDGHY